MFTKASRDDARAIGRLGGLATRSAHDPAEYTASARKAFNARFLDIVDKDRKLSTAERAKRAAAARTLHFQRMALRSAGARRARAKGHAA